LAELAVTGAKAGLAYRARPLSRDDLTTLAAARIGSTSRRGVQLAQHALRTLEHARATAAYLARGPSERAVPYSQLGEWIAVSGEDDLPLLPVNVPVTEQRQHWGEVAVREHTLRVRYVLCGPDDASAPLVVLLHGHSSRAEEYEALVRELAELRGRDGRPKYTIAVPDLPSSGYSGRLDHDVVAPFGSPGVPILTFLEDFVGAFVDMLADKHGFPKRVACLAGGSMGGNLVLRMAQRTPRFIDRFVAWSPASVWSTLTGDIIKGLGLKYTRERMCTPEEEASRHGYFREVFAARICATGRTQPEMWYRDGWPCRSFHIHRALRDRLEIYDPLYRRWHWRVAYEQLVFSHINTVDGVAPWQRIAGPLLLLAGAKDNFTWTHIYSRTQDLGRRLAARNVPGHCLLLSDTGHSIHDERPRFLAHSLDRFICSAS
jgi:pimeloyl-ACP methyl ester carboxylesterase